MKPYLCALAASLFFMGGCSSDVAYSQSTQEAEEDYYLILPEEIVQSIEELGVRSPFVLFALDIDGQLIELVPQAVERAPAKIELEGVDLGPATLNDVEVLGVTIDTLDGKRVKIDGKEIENIHNTQTMLTFKYRGSDKLAKCRWPPAGGDGCRTYN